MIFRIVALLTTILLVSEAHADASRCGDPPPVADENLKGEISGKAELLSRLIGEASLSGEIQTSRKEIFSKYPNAEQSRSNAYFEYQVCVLIFSDEDLSTLEKIAELRKIKREFSREIPSAVDSIEFDDLSRKAIPEIDFEDDNLGEELKQHYEQCLGGDGSACNTVGVRVGDGKGASRSFKQSAAFYAHACKLDFGKGCRNLGRRYKLGKGVEKNLVAAERFYKIACEKWHAKACYELGTDYSSGVYGNNRVAAARAWLREACSMDYEKACNAL